MNQYKYPVKYVCGLELQIYPKNVFDARLKFLNDMLNLQTPIVGETGIDGVLLDFNYGLRLQIPEGNWHVRISDAETDFVFIDDDLSCVTLISVEKYFIDWEIAIWLDGEPVFYHQFDPRGQHINFHFVRATLGDNITLLQYVEAFRKKFDCTVTCLIPETFYGIVKNYYPKIKLTTYLPADCYACYYLTVPTNLELMAVEDGLKIPLLRVGETILRRIETPPKKIFTATKPRKIKKPYVCIGVQASAPAKSWLNPDGWEQVVEYLKSIGYRVLCIDKDRSFTKHGLTIDQPAGVEDFSGNYTLIDRINQLAYADFFIGVSSGLSWLAWAVDIPVVLISGLTARWYEFYTPYRINNQLVCHGCFNECNSLEKVWYCPLFKGTDRAFECSKKISARQVISAIDRLIADHNLEARHEHL